MICIPASPSWNLYSLKDSMAFVAACREAKSTNPTVLWKGRERVGMGLESTERGEGFGLFCFCYFL